jgi:hypothetical protein
VCLGYAEARRAFVDRWMRLLEGTAFAGLFVCLRSQSKPAQHADQFGFNEPVRADYRSKFGRDILREDFDVQAWRDLRGSYLTALLRELRARGPKVAVGVPRGDILGPPLGNATLAWQEWVADDLIDALVIDQNSSQCPSMWHQLWPMHRGEGYLQDYLTGRGLPPLSAYGGVVRASGARLYVARQWCERTPAAERELLRTPGVSGLVFSSFRHDNREAIAKNDWTFTR